MANIILSYRRADSGAFTGRLFDRLVACYGRDAVFRDIESIPAGIDFRTHINDAISKCDVLLAIIGPKWLARSAKGKGTRIQDDDDFVRIEIETGLRTRIPVIPVLVANTKVPKASQLPASLGDLVFRNSIRVDPGQDFEHHMERLVREIDRIVGPKRQSSSQQPEATHAAAAELSVARSATAIASDIPAVAVLPFENLSDDPAQEYFCDGVTDDIITALSRWRSFTVISRHSSFAYRKQKIDVRQVGRELGARYLLEGSVRKTGERVRISASLVDTDTGGQLWSDRFDENLADIFLIQEEVSLKMAGAVGPTLTFNEGQRAAGKPPRSLSAWDHYLRGRWHYYRQGKEARDEALACFEHAIELDPGLAEAHAWVSRVLTGNIAYGFSTDRESDLRRASEAARRAVKLDNNSAGAWRALAQTLFEASDIEGALQAARKASELNPNLAEAHHAVAVTSLYLGSPEQALAAADKALMINPADPQNFAWLATRSSALYLLGRYQEAIDTALPAIHLRQKEFGRLTTPWRVLAASYAQLGMHAEAKAALTDMIDIDRSKQTISEVIRPFRRKEDRERYAEGLRKAGLAA